MSKGVKNHLGRTCTHFVGATASSLSDWGTKVTLYCGINPHCTPLFSKADLTVHEHHCHETKTWKVIALSSQLKLERLLQSICRSVHIRKCGYVSLLSHDTIDCSVRRGAHTCPKEASKVRFVMVCPSQPAKQETSKSKERRCRINLELPWIMLEHRHTRVTDYWNWKNSSTVRN